MVRRVGTGGRPNKGPRELFSTRVSPELASKFRAEAEHLDLSYSDLLANVLAERYGLPPVIDAQVVDQMRLTA